MATADPERRRRPPSVIEKAGFRPLGGTARRYRDPDGKNVSYREAFQRASGRSLEAAVAERHPDLSPDDAKHGRTGKFADELGTAERVRFLAREGLLVEALPDRVTRRQEAAIASKTLRGLTKGHYLSESTKAGLHGKGPERRTLYGRLLAIFSEEGPIKAKPRIQDYPEDADGAQKFADDLKQFYRFNGPTSDKANLLVALGYRDADAEYAVGDTP